MVRKYLKDLDAALVDSVKERVQNREITIGDAAALLGISKSSFSSLVGLWASGKPIRETGHPQKLLKVSDVNPVVPSTSQPAPQIALNPITSPCVLQNMVQKRRYNSGQTQKRVMDRRRHLTGPYPCEVFVINNIAVTIGSGYSAFEENGVEPNENDLSRASPVPADDVTMGRPWVISMVCNPANLTINECMQTLPQTYEYKQFKVIKLLFGMQGGAELSLSSQEWKRLDQLDSTYFGFLNLQAAESYSDRVIVQKGVGLLEKELLESKDTEKEAKNYLRLGHLHLLCASYARALSAYQRYYVIEDDCWRNPTFYYGLGLCYFHFRAHHFAAEAFRQVLYSSPAFARTNEIHLRLGLTYKALSEWDLALKHFNCARIDSALCSLTKCEISFHIAHCYDLKDDLKQAKELYETLLQEPDLPVHVKSCVHRQLGWLYYRGECFGGEGHERLTRAVALLNESLKLEPNSGKTYYYLGRCFSALPGRAHDAFVNYRHSIDKSEANADTWCSIGVLYQQQQQPMDALQAFVCAVQLDSQHSPAWTDLGLLYEYCHQFSDALVCFKKAAQYKPACPSTLKARIDIIEGFLQRQRGLEQFTKAKQSLPSLDEAWRLPIPLELTQRQESFLKQKQERYASGNSLLGMGAISAELDSLTQPPKPPFYLTTAQITMLHYLQQAPQLDAQQAEMYQQLRNSYNLMQQHMKFVQQQSQPGSTEWPQNSNNAPATDTGDLPLVSSEDIASILGATGVAEGSEPQTRGRQGSEAEDLLGSLNADNACTADDPMLSSAALPRTKTEPVEPAVQDMQVSTSNDGPGSRGPSRATEGALSPLLEPQLPTMPRLNLLAPVSIQSSTKSAEILQIVKVRCSNPANYKPIFDEKCPPPKPPLRPAIAPGKDDLLLACPSIVVDSKKDAFAPELQHFCYNAELALIKGLTSALKIDLGLFSTKTLVETAPDHLVEVRTQLKMAPDENCDELGTPTWYCMSNRSWTTVAKYAVYQAESFQSSLREEQERIRAGGKTASTEYEPFGKRKRDASDIKALKFGTNVDLSEERKWRRQLQELAKLPAFCRLVAGCNMLTHLGHTVLGMNTVQLYMKVPGSRTPGHQENNNFASVNINIGPGDCEWFGVPSQYWGAMQDMCNDKGINYLRGSWWPPQKDLWNADIPLYRFTQKPGDIVWIGPGCVHWVQATGWCNNIAWNVGPLTAMCYRLAIERYEWNKLHQYKSIVPLIHLSWQLARNVRFTQARMFDLLKQVLIRSLAYIQMTVDVVHKQGKTIRLQQRTKGEVAHYCGVCEMEVFCVLLALEQGGKFVVHCIDCARRIDPALSQFTVIQQYSIQELCNTYDQCTLNPKRTGVIC